MFPGWLTIKTQQFGLTLALLSYTCLWLGMALSQSCPITCQCNPQLVLCKGGNLRQMLSNLPQYSIRVDISAATFAFQLEQQHFNQCLARNNIKELTLRQSQINSISVSAFMELHSLHKLNLSFNYISNIADNAFTNLNSLEEFDASNNKLSKLGVSLRTLQTLKYLNIAHNQLRAIETGSFQYLSRLETLILDGNELRTLQGHSFQGLSNLKVLSLKGCSISQVPEDLFFITRKLQTLNLQKNLIHKIPTAQELRNLAYLRQLQLDYNQVTELGDLQFGSIPLDTLSLSHNQIRTVSKDAFKYFNAKYLDMSFNQLYFIHPGTFQPLAPEMTQLTLAGNSLTKIPDGVFHGLYRLEALNISRCNIDSLPEADFETLQMLHILDLSQNNLKNLSWGVINKMDSLDFISLEGNPWHCDCFIQPLRDWLGDYHNRKKLVCSRKGHVQRRSIYAEQCDKLRCSSPFETSEILVEDLGDQQVSVCASLSPPQPMPMDTIVIIVCVIVIVLCLTISALVIMWKRNCFKKLMKHKVKSSKQPPYYPYNSSDQGSVDLGSINESDRGFPLRTYLQALELMDGTFPDITPTESQARSSDLFTTGSEFNLETQSGSSMPSTIVVGRESCV